MVYSTAIREAAFVRYCYLNSYEATAAKMREDFPDKCASISRKTILTWAKDDKWQERKAQVDQQVAAQTDQKMVSDRQQMVGDLRTLRRRVLEQAQGAKIKSLEGAVNAYGSIAKWIVALTGEGERGRNIGPETLIMVIFEVLGGDPQIARLIEQKEEALLNEIYRRIDGQ
jgi:hypothetical protein